jgi:Glycosyltransferases, probably involved in cell wall biogenesis
VIGVPSESDASRFVDISGGLDVERHLSHPLFPFAPSGNVMYRRSVLTSVGGFDIRYAAYDSCDLNMRIRSSFGGKISFAQSAVVLHKHRETWKDYWKQQRNYGRGLAQFYRRWSNEIDWSLGHELIEWTSLIPRAAVAVLPGSRNAMLARRGDFIKRFAQRVGFASTYFSGAERVRWSAR